MRFGILLGIVIQFLSFAAYAQAYPTKAVRLLVPFAPGGSSSIVARLVGQKLSENLGQSFVIENKPGGAGNIAMPEAARAEPDGYTLILGHVGTLAVNPAMMSNLPFDTNRDFADFIRKEQARWGEVVRKAGVKVE